MSQSTVKVQINGNKINKKLPENLKKLLKFYSNKYYQKFLFKSENSKSQSLIIGKFVYKKKYLKTLNII